MPGGWNGSGVFTRYYGANTWQNDAANGTLILADRHDNNDGGLADGINACLTKNGENTFSGSSGAFRASVDNSVDLGSTSLRWRSLYAGTSVVFQGASFATTVTAAPTANRAVVLPDKAGTLALTEQYLVTNFSANTGTTTVPFLPSGLATDAWSEITVMFEGVSLSASGNVFLQLIDSLGAVVTSGYISRCMTINNTTMSSNSAAGGFIIEMGAASGLLYGALVLRREKTAATPGADTWHINGSLVNSIGTNGMVTVAGKCNLGSATPALTLGGMRLLSSGGDTFDAGALWVSGRI